MVVVVTEYVGLNAVLPLNAGVVVSVIGYVADMQDAKRPTGPQSKLFD